ncbi:MAG TPA: hypothetical protein VHE83_06575 [Mycobacteriales bacterium]|nr:hypothetical protein [Mycobacteriales bacterium]
MWRPRAPLRGHIPDVGPAVGAGVVALAVALAVLLATHPWSTSALRRPQARSGPHISDVDRWGATVRAIATARWQAFVHAEPALLDAADAPGSPARTVDAQRVAAFVAAHAHVRGPAPVPDVQQVLHAGSGVAELVVREAVPGYDEVDATGTVIDHVDATPPATWRITLVHTDAGWRTQEVSPGR